VSDEREKTTIDEPEGALDKVGEGNVADDSDDFEAHKLVIDKVAPPEEVDIDKHDEGD
jgi:hypothetical protein